MRYFESEASIVNVRVDSVKCHIRAIVNITCSMWPFVPGGDSAHKSAFSKKQYKKKKTVQMYK